MTDLTDANLDEAARQIGLHVKQWDARVTEPPFHNGLTEIEEEEIVSICEDLRRAIERINSLGRHRSYSIAITSVEEGMLWLHDRLRKAR